ncbi:MAG: ATP-dependent Clp protease proteolytic subunit [Lachnospiraceae bacterium]|nr:ATP-dependent Clp protease proteolytic subunit [Lachnospiraceae bacterium]
MEIIIPQSVDNLSLPAPELITFYKNLENRVIWLDSEVDDLYLEYARYIIDFNREDKDIAIEERKPIKLMIMSPGGSLAINNAMIDLIKMSKTPVYGYNMGTADSAACFMFMACHKRFAMPKASFLLHKGSTTNMSGTYDQVAAEMDEYERLISELALFILEHSSISEETLTQNLGGEWYVTAKQACEEYGFVDEIVTDINVLL